MKSYIASLAVIAFATMSIVVSINTQRKYVKTDYSTSNNRMHLPLETEWQWKWKLWTNSDMVLISPEWSMQSKKHSDKLENTINSRSLHHIQNRSILVVLNLTFMLNLHSLLDLHMLSKLRLIQHLTQPSVFASKLLLQPMISYQLRLMKYWIS